MFGEYRPVTRELKLSDILKIAGNQREAARILRVSRGTVIKYLALDDSCHVIKFNGNNYEFFGLLSGR